MASQKGTRYVHGQGEFSDRSDILCVLAGLHPGRGQGVWSSQLRSSSTDHPSQRCPTLNANSAQLALHLFCSCIATWFELTNFIFAFMQICIELKSAFRRSQRSRTTGASGITPTRPSKIRSLEGTQAAGTSNWKGMVQLLTSFCAGEAPATSTITICRAFRRSVT